MGGTLKGANDEAKAADVWGGLQGEGGPGCSQRRPDDGTASERVRNPRGPSNGMEKQLMTQVTDLFADGRKRRPEEDANEHELYEQIDRL